MRGHELNCKYHNVASLAQLEKKRTGEPGTPLLPQGGEVLWGPPPPAAALQRPLHCLSDS